MEELLKAINDMSDGKSLGMERLPFEFYKKKKLWPIIQGEFLKCVKTLLGEKVNAELIKLYK